jgi:MFS family permease
VTAKITFTEETGDAVFSQRRARWAVYLVLSASFVALADVSIVNLAAPVIEKGLHATVADIELAVSGYEVAFGAMLITGGRLGDIFGRRALFRAGFASFIVASAACGLAASPGQLDTFRIAQGAAAGLLSPQVLATIQIVLPPSRRQKAFAALGAVLALATILGPLISGLIILADFFGTTWRPIFWINVPIGIVAVILAGPLLPVERSTGAKRVDVAGTVLLIALCGALMAPLAVGARYGWPVWALASLASTPLIGATFVAVQRRLAAQGKDPVLPPALLRDRAFRVGLALYLMLFSSIVAFFLFYAIVLQTGYRLSTLLTGLSTIPSALGTLTFAVLSAVLVRRFGPRRVVITGVLVCAVGSVSMVVPLTLVVSKWLAVATAPSQFVAGAGIGMVIPSLLSLVLPGIKNADAGAASGLLSTAQAVGGGLGVVVMGLLFQSQIPRAVASASPGQLNSGLALAVAFGAAVFVLAALLMRALPESAEPDVAT